MNDSLPSLGEPLFVGGSLSEADFEAIRQVLLQQCGVDLGMYKNQCIRRRIATRVRACGCRSGADYLHILRSDPVEADALLAALAIHVSHFFRNPEVFSLLESKILPDLIQGLKRQGATRLRVWSAGCAGGEEPYSIALLLQELPLEGLPVEILGSDISPAVLQQAEQGIFDPLRLSEVPAPVLSRYFSPAGRRQQLHEKIRRQVRFQVHNLLSDPLPDAADLILCRNVLIYFSRADQDRILTRFADLLSVHGILVIGTTESLIGPVRNLFDPLFPVERIYRRKF